MKILNALCNIQKAAHEQQLKQIDEDYQLAMEQISRQDQFAVEEALKARDETVQAKLTRMRLGCKSGTADRRLLTWQAELCKVRFTL